MITFTVEDLKNIVRLSSTVANESTASYVLACFAEASQVVEEKKEEKLSDFSIYKNLTGFSSSVDEDITFNDDILRYNILTRKDLIDISSNISKNMDTSNLHKMYDWKYISTLKLSVQDYAAYSTHLHWDVVSRHIDPEVALEYFKEKVCWDTIAEHNNLDVEKYINNGAVFSTVKLVETQVLSETFIRSKVCKDNLENSDVVWSILSRTQKLSEEFIEEFFEKLDQFDILTYQSLSFEFIFRHINKFNKDDVLFCTVFTDEQYSMLGW